MTLVIDRSHAEDHEAGFALKPQLVSDKAYVHMYLHHDGYPESVSYTHLRAHET